MKQVLMFVCGTAIGLTTLSLALASVPAGGKMRVTDDTAIYQRLSEIQAPRQGRIDFDGDIERLAQMESRYRERLPKPASQDPRLSGPMKRIASKAYRPSASAQKKAVRN